MAGRRGFGGRSTEDLYAEAESVSRMLAKLKGTGRRGGRDAAHPQRTRWMPDLPPHQEWDDPRELRRRELNPSRAESHGPREHYYPSGPEGQHWQQCPPYERTRGPPQNRAWPEPDKPPNSHYPPGPEGQDWRRQHQYERPRNRLQDSGRPKNTGPPPHKPGDPLTAQQLVMILVRNQNLSLSLLNLMDQHNLPVQEVKIVVATHGHVFLLQNELVKLAPRFTLCIAHSSSQGCQSRNTCDGLHVCPKFVYNWCNDKNCVFGHRWHTDHNLTILRRLFLEYVPYPVLRQLLRSGQSQRQRKGKGGGKTGPLGVCREYNEASCDQDHCSSLHVCHSFVVGLTICSRRKCHLNHDLLNPTCCHLLSLHKLPVNDTQRDIATALIEANPGIKNMTIANSSAKSSRVKSAGKDKNEKVAPDSNKHQGARKNRTSRKDNDKDSSSGTEDNTDSGSDSDESRSSSDNEEKGHVRKGSHPSKKGMSHSTHRQKRSGESSATEKDSEEDSDDSPNKSSQRDNQTKKQPNSKVQPNPNTSPSHAAASKQNVQHKPPPPLRTLWAHDLHGDVAIPQICYYSVVNMCRNEATGCPRLHSSTHFHWQIRENQQDSRWFNLRPEQTARIERAFCNPALNGVDLPRLDPSKLEPSVRGLFLLLCRDIWYADFPAGSLTNSTQSKKLQLRRLCTQPVAGQTIKAATYHWYFQDINKKWVKYGEVDTAKRQDLVSSLTSADIEKHYVQNPAQPLTFNNSQFTYVLDLTAMKQTNQSTQVSREVQRRPEPHMPEKQNKDKSNIASDLPQHWDAMQPEERSRLVALAPTSDEYQKVVSLITSVSPSNLMKVERIQNPFMWRALQNKIKELTSVYKDQTKVDVRQLFHGTSHNVVASICAENFDWRLHGSATGQVYGRGTYFGTNAGVSYGYCRADSNGLKYMFVARVAIGSMTVGNSSMARPPINPATSMPYDSTVDNTSNPSMVIKYSTQEYYPEYLLTLK